MSFIDNFSRPFKNTFPFVTIVLLAILVAVFRLSNGAITVERKKSIRTEPQTRSQQESMPATERVTIDADEASRFSQIERSLRSRKQREDDAAQKELSPTPEKRGNRLRDIESALGIR